MHDIKIAVTSPSFSNNKILRKDLLNYFPNSILNNENKKFSDFIKQNFFQNALD